MNQHDVKTLLSIIHPNIYSSPSKPDLSEAQATEQLLEILRKEPQQVVDVLLNDWIRGLFVKQLIEHEKTPSFDQILQLAMNGDFHRAQERTRLAFNRRQDRETLVRALLEVASQVGTAEE
ncbi:MAG: hypothetical protein ACOYLB_05080 [Phototrophicaceae bacterium]